MDFVTPTAAQMGQIEALYLEAFPPAERAPFSVLTAEPAFAFSALVDRGKVCAMAVVLTGGPWVLLDYLAVDRSMRAGGLGSKMLAALKDKYAGAGGIFIEIERPGCGADGADNDNREARRRFYLKNGFADTGLNTLLYGVKMRLMVLPLAKALPDDPFAAYRSCFDGAPRHFALRKIRLDTD